MPVPPTYAEHDALGLAELVRAGRVHPTELVEAAAARIEELEARLNALVELRIDRALRRAAGPVPEGPFAGVPFLLKDIVSYRGATVTFGSALFGRFRPDRTHVLVGRMEACGLITVGRTTTGELGLLPTTESVLHGPTANPWDLDRSPGGSSGGSAAAVAAGYVPMAHASDGGGSIRIPASACGVFGLKPTRGRHPQDPEEEPSGLTTTLCVSRSVRDSAALLDVLAGQAPGDRWWAPPPDRPYLEEVRADPGSLRIAVTTADFRGVPAHPDCRAAVLAAARLCEELGHRVEEARPSLDGERFAEAFLLVWSLIPAGVLALVSEELGGRPWARLPLRLLGPRRFLDLLTRLRSRRPALEPFTWDLIDHARAHSPGDLWPAWNELRRASVETARFLAGYDLLLTPTLGEPPVATGELSGSGRLPDLWPRLVGYAAYTPLANVSGQPAMSVPLHWNADGLPVGVQFLGRFGQEATLLRLAGQLERARPWFDRRPPLGAVTPSEATGR